MWASRLVLLSAAGGLAATLSPFERLQLNRKPCPSPCDPGGDTTEWFTYHSVDEFAACNEPLLLNLNLYHNVDDDSILPSIRACTLGNAKSEVNFLTASGYVAPDALGETNFGPPSPEKRENPGSTANAAACDGINVTASSAMATLIQDETISDPLSDKAINDLILALQALQKSLDQELASCGKKKVTFVYFHGTLVGLYSGSQVELIQTSASMLDQLLVVIGEQDSRSALSRTVTEICAGHCTASHIFGVVADPAGDFKAVQRIMKSWNNGDLLSGQSEARTQSTGKPSLWTYTPKNGTEPQARSHVRELNPRAECRSIRAEGSDTCLSLAARCGIGVIALQSFNKDTPDFCNSFETGQPVCCSSGTLPDVGPSPNPDGSCQYHEVQEDEYCEMIAASYGLTTDDLYDLNTKTWGWDGCDNNIPVGLRICVSEGFPPLPAPVYNAVCGPTVPGTESPQEGGELAEINPCPLDVCCNTWGQCGTTVDFCIPSNSSTGNPGTSAPGENGCVDNCGMEMVNNNSGPETYRKIGYFEGWNYNRPCLNMHVDDIPDGYTHVHFAFGEFSSDLQIIIKEDHQEQWDAFISADRGYRKILSFGGWEFSNAAATSGLFRLAVSPGKRESFAENVVNFALDNGLDGLDFDWEYPGATDIPGSEPGQEGDGENYLEFLKLVREKLPEEKSVSIATAASFWYLQGFPVKEIAPVVDYFIHMTYDFHGQWDVGREWSMEGCPAGNCLRSHVNSTQTYNSLVMMTKAGVPSHKIVVGVTSYGRSFKMADATCRGPMCTFLGGRNDSPAKPGRCTETGGYISDFEINEIMEEGGAIKSWYDEETDSDYLVYDSVEWVAYMTDETKDRRRGQYEGLNCGGTTDWAIDLQGEGRRGSTGDPVYLDPIIYQDSDAYCEPPCVLVFPPSQLPSPTTIDPGEYTTSLLYGRSSETTEDGKVVTVFVTQTTTITIELPTITTDKLSYSNVNISRSQDTSSLWVGVSIPIDPVTVSLENGEGGTTTRVLTLPAWPAVTQGPPSGGESGGDDDDNDDNEEEDWEFQNPITETGELEPDEPSLTTMPTWQTYPPYVVEPVDEEDGDEDGDDDEEDDDDGDDDSGGGIITPCNLWFFNFCGRGRVKSLRWRLPPGIYPPGPPPPDILGPPPDPKWTVIHPPLPPWPKITIGHDNKLTYSEEPPCETESAELCSTTVTHSETMVGTTTSTATETSSYCATVYGCAATGSETATTTTATACPIAAMATTAADDSTFVPRQPGCPAPAIIYPKDPENVGSIPSLLQGYSDYVEVGQTTENWVAFYWIPRLGQDTMNSLRQSPDVAHAYYYEESNYNIGAPFTLEDEEEDEESLYWDLPSYPKAPLAPSELDDRVLDKLPNGLDPESPSALNGTLQFELRRDKRQPQNHVSRDTPFWSASQVSLPKDSIWGAPGSKSFNPKNDKGKFSYHYDSADASDTYVYMLGERGIYNGHEEFAGQRIEYLDSQHNFGPASPPSEQYRHGAGVAAHVLGKRLGICPSCTLVVTTTMMPSRNIDNWHMFPNEKLLSQLIDVLDDIKKKNRQGKASINMSLSYKVGSKYPVFHTAARSLFLKLDALGVVVVASANNHAKQEGVAVERYPAKFGDPNEWTGGLPNMIVVSASDWKTQRGDFSQYSPWVTTFAPGTDVRCPAIKEFDDGKEPMRVCRGTSFAAPQVAALAAYFRAVPSPWQSQLSKPSNVKKLIQLFARRFAVEGHNVDPTARRPIIWNGQVGEHSCLRDYGSKEDWAKVCPTIKENLEDEPVNPGQPVEPCDAGQAGSSANPGRRRRRQAGAGGGSCPYVPGDNGPGKNINWEEGPSAPECAGDHNCGGELCEGYYCDPDPEIPHPPDYYDPKDPENPHGQPAEPPPEPTSTTTSTPPTNTPEPPGETMPLCVGSSVTPTGEFPVYAYSAYSPGLHCDGIFIVDGNIGSSPDICDAPNDSFSFDICDTELIFVNEGPEFFSKCGFQIEIEGKKYTPRQLDPLDEDNPCSGHCDLAGISGLLLYDLPAPACD